MLFFYIQSEPASKDTLPSYCILPCSSKDTTVNLAGLQLEEWCLCAGLTWLNGLSSLVAEGEFIFIAPEQA